MEYQMKGKISIAAKSRITKFPKALVESGWCGRVPFLANASTIVLIHPKASLGEVEASLRIIFEDIRLRKKIITRRLARKKDMPEAVPVEQRSLINRKGGG